MNTLFLCFFSVVIAAGNQSAVTAGDVAKHEAETTSLTELPPGVTDRILGYMKPNFWSEAYPFDSFGRLTSVCILFKHPVEVGVLEVDRALEYHACWQPHKLLDAPPKTIEEAYAFGINLCVCIKMKRYAMWKIGSTLSYTDPSPSVAMIRMFLRSKPHPAKLDDLFSKLPFDSIALPRDLPDILYEKINNLRIYEAVEDTYNRVCKIYQPSGCNLDLILAIRKNPQKYEEMRKFYDGTPYCISAESGLSHDTDDVGHQAGTIKKRYKQYREAKQRPLGTGVTEQSISNRL